jgi:hypothetical protein
MIISFMASGEVKRLQKRKDQLERTRKKLLKLRIGGQKNYNDIVKTINSLTFKIRIAKKRKK